VIAKELANRSAYQIQYVIVVIVNVVCKSHSLKCQEDSDPIQYRRVPVSSLLHDITTFAEFTGTDRK
jgi:hypothetical protein